jgi:hypothetical protein
VEFWNPNPVGLSLWRFPDKRSNVLRTPLLCIYFAFSLPLRLYGQQIPSKPISEYTGKAGSSFAVRAELGDVTTEMLDIETSYVLRGVQANSPNSSFSCSGRAQPGMRAFTVNCQTQRTLSAGEYIATGKVTARQTESGESGLQDGIRFPIITLTANPFVPLNFPKIVNTQLQLSDRDAFSDGSRRIEEILEAMSKHFPAGMKDTLESRVYLRSQVQSAKNVVELTRSRYLLPRQKDATLPIAFEDFERRYDLIFSELGGNAKHALNQDLVQHPRYVLAQLPKTSDSITASATDDGQLTKQAKDFLNVLTQCKEWFDRMTAGAPDTFTWAITSVPPQADVYVLRTGEKERKWDLQTNMKDQSLPMAKWRFRVDWKGCSVTDTPDPFLKPNLTLSAKIEDCKQYDGK